MKQSQFNNDVTYISKREQQREDWLFVLLSNDCHRIGFFRNIRRNALAEFKLLQPLPEGPSLELLPALLPGK